MEDEEEELAESNEYQMAYQQKNYSSQRGDQSYNNNQAVNAAQQRLAQRQRCSKLEVITEKQSEFSSSMNTNNYNNKNGAQS